MLPHHPLAELYQNGMPYEGGSDGEPEHRRERAGNLPEDAGIGTAGAFSHQKRLVADQSCQGRISSLGDPADLGLGMPAEALPVQVTDHGRTLAPPCGVAYRFGNASKKRAGPISKFSSIAQRE